MSRTKRFRLRFSVRTLVIVVTIVCMYFGCWEATKRRGVDDVASYLVTKRIHTISDPEPGLIAQVERNLREYIAANASPRVPLVIVVDDVNYFWFFGYVLPYEHEIPDFAASSQ